MPPRATLTDAQRKNRAPKIAAKVRARVKELGLTQTKVAEHVGISLAMFQSSALRYSISKPDAVRLGKISLILGWPVQYLGGLLDGSIDLSEDPADLPENKAPAPVARRKWKKPTVVAPQQEAEPEVPQRGSGLRRDIDALQQRVVELERTVDFLLQELDRKRKAS